MIVMIFGDTTDLKAQYLQASYVSAMRDDGWTLANDRVADLKEGDSTPWWYRTFSQDLTYKIAAFSEDDDVLDLDLEVRYPDGTLYKKDVELDPVAVVVFTPSVDRYLKIKITNYESDTPYYASECKYLVFFKKF